MISRPTFAPFLRRSALAVITIAFAYPASAHHMGPSGVGAGGGMTVFGPATLDERHGSFWLRLVDTRPEQRSDSQLQALASQGLDAHNTSYDLNASVGAAYGLTHELTISVELPYVGHDSIRATQPGGVEHLGSIGGMGDMSLLAKYRLTPEGATGFALIAGMKVPTGSTHERDRFGKRFETEHQPGTGSWDPIFGASASTKLGDLNLAASAIYQLAGEGAQHARLGNRLQGGIALTRHFGPAEEEHGDDDHDHAADQQRHVHSSSWDAFVEVAGEVEGRQRIGNMVEQDSGGKWAWVAPGVTFTAASGWSASAAFALPVWQRIRPSHPNNAYRFMLSLGHGF